MTISREKITEQLTRSTDKSARAIAAGFPWITGEMMEQFSSDKNSIVRSCVASNPAISTSLLRQLTSDIAPHVRGAASAALAIRENSPLEKALEKDRPGSRTLTNYGLPEPQATLLHEAREAQTTPERLMELLNHGSEWVRANVGYPNFAFGVELVDPESNRLTADLVTSLVNDESGLVRAAVARNPFTPADSLRMLTGDPDSRVLLMLSSNPSSPIDVLEEISQHGRLDYLKAIAWNAALPND
jgi:hypothetical protein